MSPLRTDDVEGQLVGTLNVGDPLVLMCDPLTPEGLARVITTSPVMIISNDLIYTENSLYMLTPVDIDTYI